MMSFLLSEPAVYRPDKPKRSLNVYNVFFHLERVELLNSIPDLKDKPGCENVGNSNKKKRGHGKIGFSGLAQAISKAWNNGNISAVKQEVCDELVAQDKLRHERETREWQDTCAYIEQQELLGNVHPFIGREPALSLTVLDPEDVPKETSSKRQRRNKPQRKLHHRSQLQQPLQTRQTSVVVTPPILHTTDATELHPLFSTSSCAPFTTNVYNSNNNPSSSSGLSMGFPLPRLSHSNGDSSDNQALYPQSSYAGHAQQGITMRSTTTSTCSTSAAQNNNFPSIQEQDNSGDDSNNNHEYMYQTTEHLLEPTPFPTFQQLQQQQQRWHFPQQHQDTSSFFSYNNGAVYNNSHDHHGQGCSGNDIHRSSAPELSAMPSDMGQVFETSLPASPQYPLLQQQEQQQDESPVMYNYHNDDNNNIDMMMPYCDNTLTLVSLTVAQVSPDLPPPPSLQQILESVSQLDPASQEFLLRAIFNNINSNNA